MRYAIVISFLALSACAADLVRIEQANSLSTQAKTIVAAARAYVTDVQTRRRDAAVALIASDPSCLWSSALVVDSQWDGSQGLCDLTGVPKSRQITLYLQPASDQGLKAVTTAVAGIAAYQGALAAVLDDKPADAKETITTAIDTLTTATGDINRIAGDKIFDLGPLSSDRAKAVVALIGTLDTMLQTNLKVKAVGKIVDKTDSTALFDALDAAAHRLNQLQDGNAVTMRLAALNRAYSHDRTTLSFSDRVTRLRDLAAADDERISGLRGRYETFHDLIEQLRKSDKELRDGLAGNFSPEKRREIASANRKQIFSILSQIAAIFPPI